MNWSYNLPISWSVLRIKTLFNPSQLLALHKTGTYALGRNDETSVAGSLAMAMTVAFNLYQVVVANLLISQNVIHPHQHLTFHQKSTRGELKHWYNSFSMSFSISSTASTLSSKCKKNCQAGGPLIACSIYFLTLHSRTIE